MEDDLAAADLLKEFCGTRHTRLSHADNGAEGLRLAQAQNYDVLVVDRMLPEMDGLSLSGICAKPAIKCRYCFFLRLAR